MTPKTFAIPALLALCVAANALPPNDDATAIVRIEVFPRTVEVATRYAYRQLLLTGIRADGQRIDLTREAKLTATSELVAVSDRGLIRATRDGEGTLRFHHGDIEITVPVKVSGQSDAFEPSFVRDVQPILTRRGCNAGTCHGSAKGKNGFKLSLRGYDAEFDYSALTDDLAGRRFNRAAPEQSLFLLKPTATVPHEGGLKVRDDEPDYELLESWVRHGVRLDPDSPRVASIEVFPKSPTIPDPGSSQQFAVIATYTDGSVRDVTAHAFIESSDIEVATADDSGLVTTLRRGGAAILARFEGRYASTRLFVMGDRSGFEWRDAPENNYVDSLVYAQLERVRAHPSERCTDPEFLRRVYLDLTGRPPTPRDVETFLLDTRDTDTKRNELIDRLIGSPSFVDHWTNRWADLLQVNSKLLGKPGATVLRDWIRGAIASNLPYDEFATQILTASGSTIDNPPAAYFKALRKPDAVMEHTTQLFLGVRFNCNKCHDHPFERWTQKQHWELSAMFAQVKREDKAGSKKMPRRTVMEPGEQPPAFEEIISDAGDMDGRVRDPDGRSYGASLPYQHNDWDEASASGSRREQLAEWLTVAENPYFAKSYVNRLWSYFLGRGLIDPVDDIRAGNPPTNPELLDALIDEFVESGFDARAIMRRICQSRVYQHSIETNRWNADDELHYSHAVARRLPAEQLHDAVHLATGSRVELPGVRPGTLASELVDSSVKTRDGFLDLFGRPPRESACECERSNGVSLGQALNLVNGPTVADAIDDPENEIAELVAFERDPKRIIEELYVRFLCRPPTTEEIAALAPTFVVTDIANTAALPAVAATELERRRVAWEETNRPPVWHPIEPGNLKSKGGAVLIAQPDGSVLASGPKPEKDHYTVVAWTDLAAITGVRLEALPDDSLPSKGPGRAESGNFVLANLGLTAVPADDPTNGQRAGFSAATASFSQNGWPIAEAIKPTPKGWGIHPQKGRRHVAVFETKADLGTPGGTLLVFELDQPYGSMHTLGRFRLSVTDSKRPVRHHGLPDDVAAILHVAPDQRTAAQHAALFAHYIRSDREMAAKIRLGAAQDVAWALANSSAFLFNR